MMTEEPLDLRVFEVLERKHGIERRCWKWELREKLSILPVASGEAQDKVSAASCGWKKALAMGRRVCEIFKEG